MFAFDKAVVQLTVCLYSWEEVAVKRKRVSFCENELDCMWKGGTVILSVLKTTDILPLCQFHFQKPAVKLLGGEMIVSIC